MNTYNAPMSIGPNARTLLLPALFAITLRLALVATTYGTNDVDFMVGSAALVNHVGIAQSYSYSRLMNHPPFSFACMRLYLHISTATGIAYGDVFRFFQVLADAIAAAGLYVIGAKLYGESAGRRLALFLLLSPAAIFISGFHGNTDATMVMLMIISVALLVSGYPLAAGIALAFASGVKVVPMLALPAALTVMPRRAALRFLAGFTVVAALLFVPAILIGGLPVIRVVFGYSGGTADEWGLTGVAFALSQNFTSFRSLGLKVMELYVTNGRPIILVSVAAVTLLIASRRRNDVEAYPQAIEIIILTVLAMAPGFGVQYIAWILALLPLAFSWRAALALNGAISVFLFITYTIWSGGWPWWFADITRPGPYRYVAALAGYAMWIVVCVALAVALRRFTRRPPAETPAPTFTETVGTS